MNFNKHDITDVEFEGVDHSDYPDYCDAHIVSAQINGRQLTEDELEQLNEDSELVYDLLMNHLF